ncbi:uncharacterized protein J3R85_002304 [Psidium guajava]|nr:uncharacterized protein J3R85_002304 [Psidium guajava]
MANEKDGAIGMESATEPAASKIETDHVAGDAVASDAVPRAAVRALVPRVRLRIRHDMARPIARVRRRAVEHKGVLETEQGIALVGRAKGRSKAKGGM